jgi:flagellar basal body rod protein FlgB
MFNVDGFKVIKGLTDAIVQRQEIISNNLTNIETKNFVRQDVDFGRVLSDLKNNVTSSDNESIISKARYRDHSKPMTLESELSKLYDNHLRYLLLVKAVGHHFDHMKKALEVRAS